MEDDPLGTFAAEHEARSGGGSVRDELEKFARRTHSARSATQELHQKREQRHAIQQQQRQKRQEKELQRAKQLAQEQSKPVQQSLTEVLSQEDAKCDPSPPVDSAGAQPGETLQMKFAVQWHDPALNLFIPGKLVGTNYRVRFEPVAPLPVYAKLLDVPLGQITRIQCFGDANDQYMYESETNMTLDETEQEESPHASALESSVFSWRPCSNVGFIIHTRDMRELRVLFTTARRGSSVRDRAAVLLHRLAFPCDSHDDLEDPLAKRRKKKKKKQKQEQEEVPHGSGTGSDGIEHVFAFSLHRHLSQEGCIGGNGGEFDGWNIYDPEKEFARQQLPGPEYRISRVNEDFSICPSYPKLLAVPQEFTDNDLRRVAVFRRRGRIPVLTWKHPECSAGLWRCSQPQVGINATRSPADEQLLDLIRRLNDCHRHLYVLDARPKINAVGNRVAGAGYEKTEFYRNTTVCFLNIENIHRMRDSWQRLRKLCASAPECAAAATAHNAANGGSSGKKAGVGHLQSLEQSQWLGHVRQVLDGTVQMVTLLDKYRASVVSHCSDGWDRTTQLCSLTQLCLDPYFRTLRGFCVLIEKEWCSFGHQLQRRHGHGNSDHEDSQRSPILVQWLDCVFQLVCQFPHEFEFAPSLLRFIGDELFRCRFGTFLVDTWREREMRRLPQRTVSIWTCVLRHAKHFTNPLYKPCAAVLYPSAAAADTVLWDDMWRRWAHTHRMAAVELRERSAFAMPKLRPESPVSQSVGKPVLPVERRAYVGSSAHASLFEAAATLRKERDEALQRVRELKVQLAEAQRAAAGAATTQQ